MHTTDEQPWRAVLAALPCGVLAADGRGRVLLANARAARLLGAAPHALAGKPLRAVAVFADPATGKGFPLTRLPRAQPGQPATPVRLELRAPHGAAAVDVRLLALAGAGGSAGGQLLVLADAAAEPPAGNAGRLQTEAIGMRAANIARYFAEWLHVIANHAAAIVENVIPGTRPHEESTKIVQAARLAGSLTKRLMGLARLGQDPEGAARPEPIALPAAVAEAVRMARATFAHDNIAFHVRGLHLVPRVLAEPDYLFESLMNLFRNAAEAMPDGGTVTVTAALRRAAAAPAVALRIRDQGAGMPRELLARAFDPFFSTKAPDAALGLGLPTVKLAADRWGGAVRIRSRPGRGTTASLIIPAEPAAAPAPAPADMETVLLADDDPEVLVHVQPLLEAAGYGVRTAADTASAVRSHREAAGGIALCIVDPLLPPLDGKTVIEHILEADATAAVILCSGFPRDYLRARLGRGAWGFVQKPIEQEPLLAAVRRMLDRKVAANPP